MPKKVTPMIHVPDVRATTEWYESMGFEVTGSHEDDGEMNWAKVSSGTSSIMFNKGGAPSEENRREVDLYVETEKIDELFEGLKDRVIIIESPHDTHYGMREFIIRDLNRFWITFGEPAPLPQNRET